MREEQRELTGRRVRAGCCHARPFRCCERGPACRGRHTSRREPVAVGRLGPEVRVQALGDERVRPFVERLLDQDGGAGVCEPAAHLPRPFVAMRVHVLGRAVAASRYHARNKPRALRSDSRDSRALGNHPNGVIPDHHAPDTAAVSPRTHSALLLLPVHATRRPVAAWETLTIDSGNGGNPVAATPVQPGTLRRITDIAVNGAHRRERSHGSGDALQGGREEEVGIVRSGLRGQSAWPTNQPKSW